MKKIVNTRKDTIEAGNISEISRYEIIILRTYGGDTYRLVHNNSFYRWLSLDKRIYTFLLKFPCEQLDTAINQALLKGEVYCLKNAEELFE